MESAGLFVDTSVWSLALRRGEAAMPLPQTMYLSDALSSGASVLSTGLVLQEILQGYSGPKARDAILSRFGALPMLVPDRDDHIAAAALRNSCRQAGVQVGTVDALLAQICIRHGLTMLSTDRDFQHMAEHVPLEVWRPAQARAH